jgi:hypothetical protein
METSVPAAAAPPGEAAGTEKAAAPEEQPQSQRRRVRVPTSVLVTVLVAAFSVWIAPAFTRQWEDRQKVRELRAAFAGEIATATANALSGGSEASRRGAELETRRELLAPVRANWDVAALRVETKLRAYYPPVVAAEWNQYASDMRTYLQISLLSGLARTKREGNFLRDEIVRTLPRIDDREEVRRSYDSAEGGPPISDAAATRYFAGDLTNPNWSQRQAAFETLKELLLSKAENATAAIFTANPGGYSTTRRDLLRDLLP